MFDMSSVQSGLVLPQGGQDRIVITKNESVMTYHRICNTTRREPLVEQDMITLPKRMSSPRVFFGGGGVGGGLYG